MVALPHGLRCLNHTRDARFRRNTRFWLTKRPGGRRNGRKIEVCSTERISIELVSNYHNPSSSTTVSDEFDPSSPYSPRWSVPPSTCPREQYLSKCRSSSNQESYIADFDCMPSLDDKTSVGNLWNPNSEPAGRVVSVLQISAHGLYWVHGRLSAQFLQERQRGLPQALNQRH